MVVSGQQQKTSVEMLSLKATGGCWSSCCTVACYRRAQRWCVSCECEGGACMLTRLTCRADRQFARRRPRSSSLKSSSKLFVAFGPAPRLAQNHSVNPGERCGEVRGRRRVCPVRVGECAIGYRVLILGLWWLEWNDERQSISCSPTLVEPELTLLRCLDPDTATPAADAESPQDPWLQEDPWSRRPGAESSGSSTESKEHCAEVLCEQADRSTASTLVVVQAPSNTMTLVAPGLQLSSEANAIWAAVNGALAPRLDGIQGHMGMLVVQLSSQVQHHDQRMSDFERQLKDITAGRSTG